MSSAVPRPLALPERARGVVRMPLVTAANDTTWKTLSIFCVYRIVIALLIGSAYHYYNAIFQLGLQAPSLVVPALAAYGLASVLLLLPARLREPSLTIQVTAGVALDVLAVVVLMYASGGVRSGLGMLLLMSLAAAGLIARGRLAFFHAAIAALAVLAQQTIQTWSHASPASDFVQTGITSFAFFATAFLGFALARYARTSEQIARERGIDLANLSQINELVIRDMQDGILVVDAEGTIRQHNPRVAHLLGPLPAGRRPTIEEYAPQIAQLLEQRRRGAQTTHLATRSDRSNLDLHVHLVPIGSGEPQATVVFVEDAARARAQAQQMKLVALGRLTASIAHEIRNPLSSIGHAADLVAEGGAQDAGNQRLLAIIRENVQRLDRMVQEVLDLNRRDRAQPEAIEPRAWLATFVRDFCASERVPEDVIDVQVRTAQRMLFDRQHLDQVLWNLVRNAWRHGRKQAGSVRLIVAPAGVAGLLDLDVIDDGPGVAPEALAHLFEPFFTTESQGTGLGLYIARELCEGNGAFLEHRAGVPGSAFRVTLKAA